MARATEIERQRLLEEETLIAEATELISQMLDAQGVRRQELASRLGKSKGHVTQLLSGERNMTLRTLAAAAFALGARVELRHADVRAPRSYISVTGVSRAADAMRVHAWPSDPAGREALHRRMNVAARNARQQSMQEVVADENHSFELSS
jgi:transcriptional regulator with XRE-family HTH domain